MLFVWSLFGLLALTTGHAQAGEISVQIQGDEAVRLGQMLPAAGLEARAFNSSSLNIRCLTAEGCEAKIRVNDGDESLYLYREEEARLIYSTLRLEENEGRLGFTKAFLDSASGFEIFCSRFFSGEGENFSCSVSAGRG